MYFNMISMLMIHTCQNINIITELRGTYFNWFTECICNEFVFYLVYNVYVMNLYFIHGVLHFL